MLQLNFKPYACNRGPDHVFLFRVHLQLIDSFELMDVVAGMSTQVQSCAPGQHELNALTLEADTPQNNGSRGSGWGRRWGQNQYI